MRLLFIIDPIGGLDLAGDTSYALMLEAQARNYDLWMCEVGDLSLEHDDAIASATSFQVIQAATAADAFTLQTPTPVPLAAFDAVLMRKDPPVDLTYLQATWILERAAGSTLLINNPRGLRDLNEHLAVLQFPDLTPPTIVSRSTQRLREFLDEQGGAIIVKPVDGFGGMGIFLVRTGDPNLSSILETSTQDGQAWTVAQRYLPEAVQGDKRILLFDGDPVGAVLRVPAHNEARGNLHVGGAAVKTTIDANDQAIIRTVAPFLRSHGQYFVGLDVIGGRLTEINITSPTGIRHIDELENRNSSAAVFDGIERLLAGL